MYNLNNQPVSVNPKQLIEDINAGENGGRTSWYPEPHHSYKKVRDGNVEKSKECFVVQSILGLLIPGYKNNICSSCASIPALQ